MKMANKKIGIKIVYIILAAVILMSLIAAAASGKLPQIRLSLVPSGTVSDGVLPGVDVSAHITDVPDGEIRYLINKRMVFETPYSLGSVMLENPESCRYELEFAVYNIQGEPIYVSPRIAPGQCLENDKLSAVVKPGEHPCSYSARAYENGELKGEVTGVVTVVVG